MKNSPWIRSFMLLFFLAIVSVHGQENQIEKSLIFSEDALRNLLQHDSLNVLSQKQTIRIQWEALTMPTSTWDFAENENVKFMDNGGGVIIGNGGKIVPCPDRNGITQYYLLDYLRALIEWPGLTIEIRSQENEFATVYEAIRGLKFLDPYRYQLYTLWLLDFKKETSLVENLHLNTTSDSQEVGIMAGCLSPQNVINQKEKTLADSARYIIAAPLWEKLDMVTKAGLLLHELIYREIISFNQSSGSNFDADEVAYLTSLFSSKEIKTMSRKEYLSRLQTIGLHYKVGPLELQAQSIAFSNQGHITKGLLLQDSKIVLDSNRSLVLALNTQVTLYPNGLPQSGWIQAGIDFYPKNFQARLLSGFQNWPLAMVSFFPEGNVELMQVSQGQITVGKNILKIAECTVSFHPNGTVKSFIPSSNGNNLFIKIEETQISIFKEAEIVLDHQGNFKQIALKKAARLKNAQGHPQRFSPGIVILNKRGEVEKHYPH